MPLQPKQQPPYYTQVARPLTITLTNAQILTLPTTPIQVIPPQGLNKAILVTGAFLKFTNAGDYTNVTNNILILQTNSAPFNVKHLSFKYVGLGDGEPLSYGIATPFGDSNYLTPDMVNNIGIAIASQNTGNFTGGNAANTIELTLFYNIINL